MDGDYWHGRMVRETGWHYFEERFRTENKQYWRAKLKRNIDRDVAVTDELMHSGWHVLRFWESDVKRDIDLIADTIEAEVRSRAD